MFRLINYSLKQNGSTYPDVIIDYGDGFQVQASEQQLLNASAVVHLRRRTYKTEIEFQYVLGIYQGALAFLHESMMKA